MQRWAKRLLLGTMGAATLFLLAYGLFWPHAESVMGEVQGGARVVVIDPGHGGEDGGATGVSGTREAELNLDISLRLRDLLSLAGCRTRMVRQTDTAVYTGPCASISEKKVSDLKNRVRLVNETPQALLVSIHQNFFSEGRYDGAQVFYAATPGSAGLAERAQQALRDALDPDNRRACKRAASVYLMEKIHCTGILVECGFLSNYAEEQRLLDAQYQKRLAAALAGAITGFLTEGELA